MPDIPEIETPELKILVDFDQKMESFSTCGTS